MDLYSSLALGAKYLEEINTEKSTINSGNLVNEPKYRETTGNNLYIPEVGGNLYRTMSFKRKSTISNIAYNIEFEYRRVTDNRITLFSNNPFY
jgi:hypothetical protein